MSVVLVEDRGPVRTVTINREATGNHLNLEVIQSLTKAFREVNTDDDVRVVVLRGAGTQAFSSGVDLPGSVEQGTDPEALAGHVPMYTAAFVEMFEAMAECRTPIIGMVYGLVMNAAADVLNACDLKVAADNTHVAFMAARVGVTYTLDGIGRLLDTLGPAYTKELMLTARPLSAERVREIGLVNWVHPLDEVETVTYELADHLAKLSPLSLTGIKRVIAGLMSDRQSRTPESDAALQATIDEVWSSEDAVEALTSVFENREPHFRRR